MTDLLDLVRGCTFDDFLFSPQYSVVERRDPAAIDLTSRISEHLSIRRPIVSANMDTVTRSEMAIAVAEEGGIGIIDRGFRSGEIDPQVREVQIVKRKQHGIISDPYTIAPSDSLAEAVYDCDFEETCDAIRFHPDGERRITGYAPAGTSEFQKPLGLVIRRFCAPVLDLEPLSGGEAYVARRLELGAAEVNHARRASTIAR